MPMNKKDVLMQKLKKRLLYMIVIVVSVIMLIVGLIYSSAQVVEIAFGLFSGSVTAFISSSIIGKTFDEGEDDEVVGLLDAIAADLPERPLCPVEVFDGEEHDLERIRGIVAGAKKRIWVLCTNATNTLSNYRDSIRAALQAGPSVEVRFMVLHPNNLFIATRYHEIGWADAESMRQSVMQANADLAAFRQTVCKELPGAKFDVRFYVTQPTVCLMIVDDTFIVSHILAGARVRDSVRILYRKPDEETRHDLFEEHFSITWNKAENVSGEPRESGRFFSEYGKEVAEYDLKKMKRHTGVGYHAMCRWLRLAGHHFLTLLPSLFLLVIAVAGLPLLGYLNMEEDLISDNLMSTALGIIAGSALAIVEYIFDCIFDSREAKESARKLDAAKQQIADKVEGIISTNENYAGVQFGIRVYPDRDSVALGQMIRNAKRRVWIYATNHMYVKSLEVSDYLKENEGLDVRFLMLAPNSIFLDTRFHDIPGKETVGDFSGEIAGSLETLYREYRGYGGHVRARIYVRPPTFMMYLVDNVLVVSHILMQGRARKQVHFAFNLLYPEVYHIAQDFLSHFETVWNEARELAFSNSLVRQSMTCKKARSRFFSVEGKNYVTVERKALKEL